MIKYDLLLDINFLIKNSQYSYFFDNQLFGSFIFLKTVDYNGYEFVEIFFIFKILENKIIFYVLFFQL